MYLFDEYGWYAGEGDSRRSTPTAPTNLSQTATQGAMRANWTGREWVDAPYFEVVADVQAPTVVTMRQARLALLSQGLLSNVDAAIAALPEPDKSAAQIEWEYSQTVERNRPFVQTLGAALGLDDSQLDALFVLAETL